MKEKEDDEEQMDNNSNQMLNDYNVKNDYNQNIQKDNLPSMYSLIEPKDGNKLQLLDTMLQDNSIDDEYDTSNILDEEEPIGNESNTPKKIYNAKDYVFTFFLLMSSSLNYSILYFPLVLLGFILTFLLNSTSEKIQKVKKICEIFTVIYSLLLLIFKIVFVVLTKKDNSWVIENQNLLINLGIKLLKDKESITYLITTFISESVLLVISIIALILSNILGGNEFKDDSKSKLTRKELFKLFFKHLLTNYFMFLFLAMFNTSLVTLTYLFIINILLIFIAKHSSVRILTFFFKLFAIMIFIFIILQIALINVLNIYHFADIIAEKQEKDKYYSVFTQIGINFMYNTDDLLKIFLHWISYFYAVASLLSLSSSNNNITFNIIYRMNNNPSLSQEDINEKQSTNPFIRILIEIKKYFTSPYFILHICRIFAIAYLYFFRNFYAIIVFIWLLCSFLFLRVESNKGLTFILTFVMLISLLVILMDYLKIKINMYFQNLILII